MIFSIISLSFLPKMLFGHCDAMASWEVKVSNWTLVFTANVPEIPDANYAWGWEYAGTNNSFDEFGTSFPIPIPNALPQQLIVRLYVYTPFERYECIRLVNLSESCENADWQTEITDCKVQFLTDSPNNLVNETWNFGDGSVETCESQPCYEYGNGGTYEVCHSVALIDSSNPIDRLVQFCYNDVTVNCEPSPCSAAFEVIEISDCCQLEIMLDCNCTDPIISHVWNFGDGTTSNQPCPSHLYTNFSTYETPMVNITHQVYDQSGVLLDQAFITHSFGQIGVYVGHPNVETEISTVQSSINQALLFPGNEVQSRLIHINGDLNIDKSFVISDCDVCVDPAIGINVVNESPDTFLDFEIEELTHVHNAQSCPMWRSIQLQERTAFFGRNSTIEGGMLGLHVAESSTIVRLNETIFTRDFIGLFAQETFALPVFEDNQFLCPSNLPPLGSLTIPNNEIGVNVPFLQERTFAGIATNRVQLGMPEAADFNYFNELFNGIWMVNSHADVLQNCRFEAMISGSAGDEFGGVGIRFQDNFGNLSFIQNGLGTNGGQLATFEQCDFAAIQMVTNAPNSFIDSRNNIIDDVRIGYDLIAGIGNFINQGPMISTIANNVITTNDEEPGHGVGFFNSTNIPSRMSIHGNEINTDGQNDVGVYLIDNTGTEIIHNFNVSGNNEPGISIGPNSNFGIFIQNFDGAFLGHNIISTEQSNFANGIYLVNSSNNTISCNEIIGGSENFSVGLRLWPGSFMNQFVENRSDGTETGIQVGGLNLGTNLTCNVMIDNEIGLSFTANSMSVIGDQDSQGNLWLGNWIGDIGAQHLGSDMDISLSKFHVQPNTNQVPPSIFAPNEDPNDPWFIFDGDFPNCPSCVTEEPPGNNGPTIDETDEIIIFGGLQNPLQNWTAQKYLFKKLQQNPELANENESLKEFLIEKQESILGKLFQTATNIETLFEIPTDIEQILIDNFTETQNIVEELKSIDTSLADEFLTNASLNQLMESRTNLANQFLLIQTETENVNQNLIEQRAEKAIEISSQNAEIPNVEEFQAIEQELHDIYLNTIAKNLPITLVQKEKIAEIAHQCYDEYGLAVLWARAWHFSISGEAVEDLDCGEIAGFQAGNIGQDFMEEIQQGLAVFPNPAKDNLTIVFGALDNTQLIRISNQLGMLIQEIEVEPNNTSLNWEIPNLSSGIYIIQLIENEAVKAAKKLIIKQ